MPSMEFHPKSITISKKSRYKKPYYIKKKKPQLKIPCELLSAHRENLTQKDTFPIFQSTKYRFIFIIKRAVTISGTRGHPSEKRPCGKSLGRKRKRADWENSSCARRRRGNFPTASNLRTLIYRDVRCLKFNIPVKYCLNAIVHQLVMCREMIFLLLVLCVLQENMCFAIALTIV